MSKPAAAPKAASSKPKEQTPLNLTKNDPFNEDLDDDLDDNKAGDKPSEIHVRVQQRNGRKTITTVTDYDLKKILKEWKKEFACNGTIVTDEDVGKVIQLQGDHRVQILKFFTDEGVSRDSVKMHGF